MWKLNNPLQVPNLLLTNSQRAHHRQSDSSRVFPSFNKTKKSQFGTTQGWSEATGQTSQKFRQSTFASQRPSIVDQQPATQRAFQGHSIDWNSRNDSSIAAGGNRLPEIGGSKDQFEFTNLNSTGYKTQLQSPQKFSKGKKRINPQNGQALLNRLKAEEMAVFTSHRSSSLQAAQEDKVVRLKMKLKKQEPMRITDGGQSNQDYLSFVQSLNVKGSPSRTATGFDQPLPEMTPLTVYARRTKQLNQTFLKEQAFNSTDDKRLMRDQLKSEMHNPLYPRIYFNNQTKLSESGIVNYEADSAQRTPQKKPEVALQKLKVLDTTFKNQQHFRFTGKKPQRLQESKLPPAKVGFPSDKFFTSANILSNENMVHKIHESLPPTKNLSRTIKNTLQADPLQHQTEIPLKNQNSLVEAGSSVVEGKKDDYAHSLTKSPTRIHSYQLKTFMESQSIQQANPGDIASKGEGASSIYEKDSNVGASTGQASPLALHRIETMRQDSIRSDIKNQENTSGGDTHIVKGGTQINIPSEDHAKPLAHHHTNPDQFFFDYKLQSQSKLVSARTSQAELLKEFIKQHQEQDISPEALKNFEETNQHLAFIRRRLHQHLVGDRRLKGDLSGLYSEQFSSVVSSKIIINEQGDKYRLSHRDSKSKVVFQDQRQPSSPLLRHLSNSNLNGSSAAKMDTHESELIAPEYKISPEELKAMGVIEKRESTLSPQEMALVKETCQLIDFIRFSRKKQEIEQKRRFQDPDLFNTTDEESDPDLALEKKKRQGKKKTQRMKARQSYLEELDEQRQMPGFNERQGLRMKKQLESQIQKKVQQIKEVEEKTHEDDESLDLINERVSESSNGDTNEGERILSSAAAGLQSVRDSLESDAKIEIKEPENVTKKDRDFRKAFSNVHPQTATFLGSILKDVHLQSEKTKVLRSLKTELKQIMDSKIEVETKYRIDKTFSNNNSRKGSPRNSIMVGSGSVSNFQTNFILAAVKKHLVTQVKEQLRKKTAQKLFDQHLISYENLVSELKPKTEFNFKEASASASPEKPKKKRKKKHRLRDLIRKHFLGKKKKLDLVYLTKVVNMQDKLDTILPQNQTVGDRYFEISRNMWANDYLDNFRSSLAANGVNLEKLAQSASLLDVNNLFTDTLQKMKFYKQAKLYKLLDTDIESKVNQEYLENCLKLQEIPLPTFVKMNHNCLFLSEFRISDCMSEALKDFLIGCRDNPLRQVTRLFIDDCGMRDPQLAQIIKGIQAQGKRLRTFVYSNNDMGSESAAELVKLVPHLLELQISNLQRTGGKLMYQKILKSVMTENLCLQKLKLSNVNLSDGEIVNYICDIIRDRPFISHLDFSWGRLLPRQLFKISDVLKDEFNNIRSLNLSYNNLYFDENNIDLSPSEDFIENIVDFITFAKVLSHIDLSGMNMGREQVSYLAQTMASSETLMGIHLSDNGIRLEEDYLLEIIDMFGLSDEIFAHYDDGYYKNNRPVSHPEFLKEVFKKHTGSLTATEVNQSLEVDASLYKKHVLQVRQSKSIQNNKLINQTQTAQGIGRLETNLVDQFVLTRKINAAELVWNQQHFKDEYWEIDHSEQWTLSDKNECFICQKHRYTIVFFDQNQKEAKEEPPPKRPFYEQFQPADSFTVDDSMSPEKSQPTEDKKEEEDIPKKEPYKPNQDMVEIKDPLIVAKVRDNLNAALKDADDNAPFIVGTLIGDHGPTGFGRKAKMMRGDLFTMLSVCQANEMTNQRKQTVAIKKGINQFVSNTQNIKEQECIDFFKGWERILFDKCQRNEVQDINVINMPPGYEIPRIDKRGKKMKDPECGTFVYAAFLPPGRHQLMIYCPVKKKLFCKEIVVDLSSSDFYPEFPTKFEIPDEIEGQPKTRSNVWRKFRIDSEQDILLAFSQDIKESFDPSLFLKDQEDIDKCKEILLENFKMLQIAYIEGLAGSPSTYPEISFEKFMEGILEQQVTEAEQKRLPRAQIELAFIRATRGDDAFGIGGTLCRGEYFETLLRLVSQIYPKQDIAGYLPEFLKTYIRPVFENSIILSDRAMIRDSKRLNQLLFDNAKGLRVMYNERMEKYKGFTYQSAKALFATVSATPKNPMEPFYLTLRHNFVYSKMTNLHDLTEANRYNSLTYVEFLELLCRFCLSYWRAKKDENPLGYIPHDMEDKVYEVMEVMWEFRKKFRPKQEKKKGGKRKKKDFPDLQPIPDDESDY